MCTLKSLLNFNDFSTLVLSGTTKKRVRKKTMTEMEQLLQLQRNKTIFMQLVSFIVLFFLLNLNDISVILSCWRLC